MIENFGDAPFVPNRVARITVAAMTACAVAVRSAFPGLALGINVLRNDAEAALAIAIASGADLIRINVHTGARMTDQGLVEGRAHETLRLRRNLGATHIRLLCDVDVKHSAPLARRALGDEAEELAERGLADAVLVTGPGTGRGVAKPHLDEVLAAVRVPVLVASGATEETLADLCAAHGVIVGSCLRKSGRAGDPIDHSAAARFAGAFRRIWRAH
jgi:membrane complex biogenesis BtpA family protein